MTFGGKEGWKFAKKNIFTETFHRFKPLGNLEMVWLMVTWIQIQPCSKSALFSLYTHFIFFRYIHASSFFVVYTLRFFSLYTHFVIFRCIHTSLFFVVYTLCLFSLYSHFVIFRCIQTSSFFVTYTLRYFSLYTHFVFFRCIPTSFFYEFGSTWNRCVFHFLRIQKKVGFLAQ